MFKKILLLALISFVATGCTVVKEFPAAEPIVETKAAEHELARKLVHAFVKGDAKGFVSLLPEDTQNKFDTDAFEKYRSKIIESAGEPISFTYLTALELQALTPQIWKIRFRRVNNKSGQEFTSEVLFRVITGMSSKKTAVITSFQFI